MRKNLIIVMIAMLFFAACSNNKDKNDNDVTEKQDSINPLLKEYETQFKVPPFDKIKPEHFMPAFEEAMKQQKEAIEKITANTEEPDFSNTIEPYMFSGELMGNVSRVFFGLSSCNTNKEIQAIEKEVNPKLSAFSDEISMNPELFKKIKAVHDKKETLELTDEQSYLLENLYKTFVRRGALLPDDKQAKLKEINQRLSVLKVRFRQNLLAETNDFKLIIEKEEDLAGLPETVVATAAETAERMEMPGKWVFTTQKPSMIPFLQYAENRDLREKIYTAYTTRGNNANEYDNKEILAEIVKLRADKAKLLGYKNHAEYRLETRMAKTPDKVFDLLNKLWDKALKVGKKEAKELQAIIDKEGGDFKLQPWDWWYYAEKLRKEKYDLDENELRPYFKLENVRDGIFTLAGKLYGVSFTQIDVPTPHPDVTAFEVKEEDGSHVGVLYLDFFPRESKRGGAWCGSYRSHVVKDGKEVAPVITVVGNFTKPTKDKPSLLSMDETETFFHEFGHALDGLFSEKSYPTSYVARDFVELPSQIMEHWAFHPEMLAIYAKHYETGEKMPDELVEKIRKSKYFNQGFANVEYLAAAMLDMAYHTAEDVENLDVEQFEKDYFAKTGLIPEIISRYRSTYFAHIIGGYDAGYYSYIWSAVLDHDAFDAFNENGVFDKATARLFRTKVLERNGIVDPLQMYIDFRGREAVIEPLLRNRGLN